MSHSTALGQVLRFLPTRCLTSPAPAPPRVTGNRIWVAGGQRRAWGGGAGDLDVNPSLLFLAGAKRKKKKKKSSHRTSKQDQIPLSVPAP